MSKPSWIGERTYLWRKPFLLVLCASLAFVLLFSVLQFRLYDGFRMGLRDLAFFEQPLQSTLDGKPFSIRQGYTADTSVSHLFYSGWDERSLFSEHTYWLVPFMLPLYAIFRTPYSLFVLNALLVAAAALPLYLLARRRLRHEWGTALIAVAYLLHPAVQVATLGDWVYGIHPDNIAPLCFFSLLYFADVRRARSFWLMGLLALLSVESLAPSVAAIGVVIALRGRAWRRHALALSALAIAAFVVSTLVVIPMAGGGRSPYYFAALQSWIVALRHPDMFAPIAQASFDLASALLVPLALLPLLGGWVWLIALPELLTGLAAQTVGYPIPMEYGSWHVWAYVVAASIALIEAAAFLRRRTGAQRMSLVLTLLPLASALGLVWFGPYPFSRNVWPPVYDVDVQKSAFVNDILAHMPFDASLSVEFFLGSHVAARPNVYWFPVNWRSAQYVLVDSGAWAWWSEQDDQSLAKVQRSSAHELIAHERNVFLFKHKPEPAVQHPVNETFANGVELVGYNLEPNTIQSGAPITVTLFWRSAQPLPLNLTVFAHVLDASGKPAGQHDGQPDNGAYPTSEWSAGETVVDPHRIKLADGAVLNSYSIEIGMYDLKSGVRLLTNDGADHFLLKPVEKH